MKNQEKFPSRQPLPWYKKRVLILAQFFLIIFVYHTLKDLKDTIVITGSDAGAEVIPFIKIWGMLPLAIAASYCFSVFYNRFGREKTLYIFILLLMGSYVLFAFFLYPFRNELYLGSLASHLKLVLPVGCKGFIAMVCNWHYTLFYLTAELWSLLILSILFWGYINETTSFQEAKKFYPLCMFTGNFAGILSGQISHFLCHNLMDVMTWQSTLQLMISTVAACALAIACINWRLSRHDIASTVRKPVDAARPQNFKDNVMCIFKSRPLLCIAILVVGFGLTSNLIEVVWKENIRSLHPAPQAYNAYINQLTSIIGILAVCMAIVSRWIFKLLSWTKVAMLTPLALFFTSSVFFLSLMAPQEYLSPVADFLGMAPLYLIVTLGSLHYVLGLTAKYTIFDSTKEMAFLSIDAEDRMRAKSVIDSIGSRLGKSGASCLYQFLLITFGATSGHISVIGMTSVLMIGISVLAAKNLGSLMSKKVKEKPPQEEQKDLVPVNARIG